MRTLIKYLSVLVLLFYPISAFAALNQVQDEGTVIGYPWAVNCVGAGVVCTLANSIWTITVGAGGTGDFSSNTSTSVDGEVVLFSGTGGKTGKRATGSGIAKLTSGVLGVAAAGTDYVAATSGSSIQKADGSGGLTAYAGATSCTNQFMTGLSGAGASTCTTDTLASAQHANQGTTTTVLHGNGAGNPSFASVIEGDLGLTDITTANASTSAHGLLLKLDNNSAHYMNGQGAWTTPAGSTNYGVVGACFSGTSASRTSAPFSSDASATESAVRAFSFPTNVTLIDIAANVSTAAGAGNQWVVTANKTGTGTAVTCTISGASAITCSLTGQSVAFTATTDLLNVSFARTGANAPGECCWAIKYSIP